MSRGVHSAHSYSSHTWLDDVEDAVHHRGHTSEQYVSLALSLLSPSRSLSLARAPLTCPPCVPQPRTQCGPVAGSGGAGAEATQA